MNDPKLDKVNTQIANTKAKISEYQTKLRVLERQKTDIENERIIALIRSEKISDAELGALMKSIRRDGSEPAETPVREITGQKEDTHNAEPIQN